MVAAGKSERPRWPEENSNPLEIIDLINTKLKSDIMIDVNTISRRQCGATGGILQNQPVICGGYDNDGHGSDTANVSVMSLIGMPNQCFKLMSDRICASSVVLNESKMWVTGGELYGHDKKSTEILSLDRPSVPGPDLPFTVFYHSMVLVDPTTIYLIGGVQNDHHASNKTWIIDPTNDFQIKEGPSLNIGRVRHSCSKMRIEGRIFLVVAGGQYDLDSFQLIATDSVELIDTSRPDQGWKMGMK